MKTISCFVLFFFLAPMALVAQTAAPVQPAIQLQPAASAPTKPEAKPTAAEVEPNDEAAVADVPAGDDKRPSADSASDAAAKSGNSADATDAALEAARKAAEKAAANQRKAVIAKLQFDRRASTALRMWGLPDQDDNGEQAGPQKPATSSQPPSDESEPPTDKPKTPAQIVAEEMAAKKMAFDEGIAELRKNVTLGHWDEVGTFIKSLDEGDAKQLYLQMITSLSRGPGKNPNANQAMAMMQGRANAARFREQNVFSLDDVFGIIRSAPQEIDKPQLLIIGQILKQSLSLGHDLDELLKRLRREAVESEDALLTRRQIALLLFAAGQENAAGEFLPSAKEAQEDNDREGLNLLARYAMARYAKDKKVEYLEEAWQATQAALAVGEIDKTEKAEALRRAVELAPKIREEFGQKWLDESFTDRIDRGKEILATIGVGTAMNMLTQAGDPKARLRSLELQKIAVEALTRFAPEKAKEWREPLTLLANNWLREAQFSYEAAQSTSISAQLRRDVYGNYYYANNGDYSFRNPTASRGGSPIAASDMLETRPSDSWITLLADSLQPRFQYMFAQLYLKVNEEELAFPFIEKFAKDHPDTARDLAHEFLRVWIRNHDPNANRNRTNYYMFSYGYNRRANQIPLTRSKQERNLKELSEWVKRLRSIPIPDLDEKLLTQAFQKSHSSAEVYRLESIESVFGSLDELDADTLAEMIQHMRGNLISIWRDPAVQKNNNTNRKKADMEAEVVRGYQVANDVLEKALRKHSNHWRLTLAKASLLHDQNDYLQSLNKSSEYVSRRDEAMQLFQTAADQYAAVVETLSEDEETTQAYDLWYYASLGAVDLGKITEDSVPDLRQPARIREKIEALPGPRAERHLAMFANSLFTRMSTVKPEMKYRYLKTGFEIVGDHKRAYEAKKVYDYYKDLVTEIRVETKVDGPTTIDYRKPFGIWVNIVHTKEIERESGGFSKYLQNQNNVYYAYNYGRPTENYRDKFQEATQTALNERFEVLSITFNDPNTTSKAAAEYGWRYTPYAYILLKPRGPEVDMIPELQIDFDFLDTSGYAVIPIASSPIPIDASATDAPRPFSDLTVTQTLDERQANEGKLILEIKATSHGLVPELDDICDLTIDDFEVQEIEDQGLSVARFDPESDDTNVLSERVWLVNYTAKEGLAEPPRKLTFPAVQIADAQTTFQRYVDADLEQVNREIALEASYAETQPQWVVWTAGIVGLIGLSTLAIYLLRKKTAPTARQIQSWAMPEEITPFTVLGLLKKIESNNGLDPQQKNRLAQSIRELEFHYFVQPADKEPDLRRIAEDWIQQCV